MTIFSAAIRCALLLPVLALNTPASASPARKSLKEGARQYEHQDFEKAAETFDRAADEAAPAELDPAVAFFNRGNALFQVKKYAESLVDYAQALHSSDLSLQSCALYNSGNALRTLSEEALQNQKPEESEQYLLQALASYEKAVLLNPADEDMKINYELAVQQRERLLAAVAQAEAALARATEQVARFEFQQAYDLLSQGLTRYPLALAFRPTLKEQFTEMLDKTGKVLGVKNTESPAPVPAEPAAPEPRSS